MKTLLVSAVLAITLAASNVAFASPTHNPERGSTSPERSITIDDHSRSTQGTLSWANEPE
jgi:hypothetical protein